MSSAPRSTTPSGHPSMLPVPYAVTHFHRENADTVTLAMEPTDGAAVPAWRPGEFTMLYVFGIGEIPVSISGDATSGGPLVQTVRDVGAVSHAITELRPGDALGVRGPLGRGWWDGVPPAPESLLIVAGGLGLAPVRPLIYQAAASRAGYRRAAVVIGARDPGELLYTAEYSTWRAFGLEVAVTVDHADESWTGRTGLVTKPLADLTLDPERTTAFLCGPEPMMTATAAALVARGMPRGSIRVSLERSMKCGTGVCGHCQLGPLLLCRDGPCVGYDQVADLLAVKEL